MPGEIAVHALLFIGVIASIYVSGTIARQRGRSFHRWALFAAVIAGPLAIAMLYCLPDLNRRTASETA